MRATSVDRELWDSVESDLWDVVFYLRAICFVLVVGFVMLVSLSRELATLVEHTTSEHPAPVSEQKPASPKHIAPSVRILLQEIKHGKEED